MKCADSCRLFGAYEAVSGIRDNVVLIHSVIGCNFGTMSFHITRDMSDMRQSCTVISDKDIIFNGEGSLREAIENVTELYSPKSITVISGCVSAIIGDDINSVISEYKNILPIFHIDGVGFKGNFEEGYEDALLEFAKNTVIDVNKEDGPAINLLGLNYDDFKLEPDMKEFRRMLNNKVKINCITADCSIEQFSTMGKASLNLVFKRGKKLGEFLKSRLNTEFIQLDYPYGIKGAHNFLNAIGGHFNINFEYEKEFIKNETLDRLKKAYAYIQAFYGLPVCVFGNEGRAMGLKVFLEEELGMEVVCLGINKGSFSMEDFMDEACKSDASLIFGTSFEGELSDRMEIPLIRYHYPVFDRISISDTPYVGGKGAIHMTEDILHYIIDGRTNKGALL